MNNKDLIEALIEERATLQRGKENVLNEALDILNNVFTEDEIFRESDVSPTLRQEDLALNWNIDPSLVFEEQVILSIAKQYGASFKPTAESNCDIPQDAAIKVNDFQQKSRMVFNHYKILILPESENRNKGQCLLFGHMGSNMYCIIHAWPKQNDWYQDMKSFSIKYLKTKLFITIILGMAVAMLLSVDFFPESFRNNWLNLGLARLYLAFSLSGLLFIVLMLFEGLFSPFVIDKLRKYFPFKK